MSFTSSRTIAAAALAFGAAVLPAAAHAESYAFTRDGVSYRYEETTSKGVTLIKGTADGRSFWLRVKNGKVSGVFGSYPISFSTAEVITQRTLAMK